MPYLRPHENGLGTANKTWPSETLEHTGRMLARYLYFAAALASMRNTFGERLLIVEKAARPSLPAQPAFSNPLPPTNTPSNPLY